jgi:HD-like signal output (HDOD) protein
MSVPAERLLGVNHEQEPPNAEKLVAGASALESPPMVCVKMFELVRSALASAAEIGEVVALDPNLSVRLLRIVNSSFYGFPSTVNSIARAVAILGTRDLNNLVLAICAVRSFSKVGSDLLRLEAFWQHSVYCALLARQLAKKLPHPRRRSSLRCRTAARNRCLRDVPPIT